MHFYEFYKVKDKVFKGGLLVILILVELLFFIFVMIYHYRVRFENQKILFNPNTNRALFGDYLIVAKHCAFIQFK
jgi:hypothetical protein